MADFDLAMADLNRKEGGHSNHKYDKGGKTYRGIARKYHDDWPGWEFLENGKQAEADEAVDDFYYAQYWQPIGGADIADQSIANELFEQGVHQTPRVAVKRLQRVLNALNNMGRRWADLRPDGVYGGQTDKALNSAIESRYTHLVLFMVRAQHGVYLLERMENDPTQEVFGAGWLNRVMT